MSGISRPDRYVIGPATPAVSREPGRLCWSVSVMTIFGALIAAFLVVAAARYIRFISPASRPFYDFLGLGAVLLFLSPGLYLILGLQGVRFLKWLVILGSLSIIAAQSLSITGQVLVFDPIPILGADSQLHNVSRWVLMFFGMTIMFASLYVALLETAVARKQLLAERADLIREMAERKQLEQQLVSSQKMEGIARLAGGIAHDFNNLLTCIMGYSDAALEFIPKPDPLRGDIEQIVQAAQRASDLTRQLLAFARKQPNEPRNTDLNTLTLNLEKMLHRLIGEDVKLITRPWQKPAVVCIDPGQFEQVILNLAVNARDAMPSGGDLTISIGHVRFHEDYAQSNPDARPGDYIKMEVTDTGTGMTDEVRSHLFEPFFTTKDPTKGTGLGLATCYGIIRQARGHITVESRPGKGATFRIYLPQVAGVPAPEPASAVAPRSNGHEMILLVEDEPLVRAIVSRTLAGHGYKVIEAHDGDHALTLSQARDEPIDLLLTDVILPHMNGREVAERIRAQRPGIKVLFMSGYTGHAVSGSSALGLEDFLAKPFTPETLAHKVRSVLDRPRPHPDTA
ncbi:MAG: response regulator [Candidatus Hydrogenedentes bacterium]|nr:response regulator [Candidatus Hydrogenedentota bacterium]